MSHAYMRSDEIRFPSPRKPLKRMPHTSPALCRGHDRYLDRLTRQDKGAVIAHYYCRYCGDYLRAIV